MVANAATTTRAVDAFDWGLPSAFLTLEKIEAVILYRLIRVTLAALTSAWAQSALGLSLTRVTEGWMRTLVFAILAMVNLVALSRVFLTWFQCTPASGKWEVSVRITSCVDEKATEIYYPAFCAGE